MFKPIPNYENYLVDENGNVFSKNINRFLKQGTNEKGYKTITLSKNDIRYKTFVHRIVALAFIPNPNNLPQVNHKDENKQNNNVSNLEWCDNKYNQNYGKAIENRINKMRGRKLSNETKHKIRLNQPRIRKVAQLDLDNNLIKIWNSQGETKLGDFQQSKVGLCCLNKRKTHKGFIWRFADELCSNNNR